MHLNRTGLVPDNLEGMTLGPRLADGRPTLVLISDDNFNPGGQVNQVLVFALGSEAARIHDLQGAAHRSPLETDWVRGVRGIVTAVDNRSRSAGFWMQTTDAERDDDPATSEGIFVARRAPDVVAGELVEVDGAVVEEGFEGALTVTTLRAAEVRVLNDSGMPPAPLEIGHQRGRLPPTVVDDDRLQSFDPCCDAIDFLESLEGMQVRVITATTVGGTTRFNEIAVITEKPEMRGARTPRGGVLLRPGDPNPHRLLVDDRLTGEAPEVGVGQRLQGPLVGVIDYGFSNYRLQPNTVPRFTPAVVMRETARPERPGEISIATYNVLNLDAADEPQKFERLARSIVGGLGAPSILGLQEVQDDNGADDQGVVSARQTLARLVEAIERIGGPTYEFRQIDPEHNADGGQPNGNIRVVWLFDPARVDVPERGTPSADTEAAIGRTVDGRPYLTTNPARLGTRSPAFAGDPARGWASGRKCLALEARVLETRVLETRVLEARGSESPLFLINCHLKSKRGDDRWFGSTQPPVFHTEEQRSEQVRGILEFVRSIQLTDPQARVIVLGDMNEHEFRPPMRLLSGTELLNITERVPLESRYSYNFNGNSQLLDHILVSPALEQSVSEIEIIHLNADLADRSRASDHDPVLVRLALGDD
jgi:predicted extracellular nuclease